MTTSIATKANLDDLLEGYPVEATREDGHHAMVEMSRINGDDTYTVRTFSPKGRSLQNKTFRSIESVDDFFKKLNYITL
jgi:hypothetical protein